MNRIARTALPAAALTVVAGALWWAQNSNPPPPAVPPAPPTLTVEVPLNAPVPDRRSHWSIAATLRWGNTGARSSNPTANVPATVWDGYVAVTCGTIVDAEPLGTELAESGDAQRGGGDRLGPVVTGDAGDSRVYWRSTTRGDWDGVRVRILGCKADAQHRGGSSLVVVTAQKRWMARLEGGMDTFVTLPVAPGASIDVHLSAELDGDTVQRARVSAAPPTLLPQQPMASDERPADRAVAE